MPITLDGTNGITTPTYGGADTSEYLVPVTQFKNRIINGAMVIDQRNAGASVTPANSAYTLDRWQAVMFSTSARYSVQQNAGSVTPPAGFRNYLGITSLSAHSVTGNDIYAIGQQIEGFNMADVAWGTANAKTVTLSFWVRSSLTGTFGGAFSNASDRSYPFTYTISAANTWEYKTITVVGDTSGTWNSTNGTGIQLRLGLGAGSSSIFAGSAGSWQAGNFSTATGCVSVVGTNGATFYITGVQLEVGSTATSFDYRPYGTELALCQRYYYRINGSSTAFQAMALGFQMSALTTSQITAYPAVDMRSAPTLGFANLSVGDYTTWGGAVSSISGSYTSPHVAQMQVTHGSGGASFRPTVLNAAATSGCYLDMSSEL